MTKRGVALMLVLVVIIVLTILGAAIIMRNASERSGAQRYLDSTRAFWLAEAGIARALKELESNYNVSGNALWSGSLSQVEGSYSVDVADVLINNQTYKKVTSYGYVPQTNPRASRILEAMMKKYIPSNFYDNAIYSGGEVDFNGGSYTVNGNVLYAEEIENPANVSGTITQDPSASPLALLDFEQLLSISQSQQNVYVKSGNKLVNQYTGSENFPSTFWYSAGVPNVVYVQADLTLNGNIGTIGGFFVVAGDVITNPAGTYDATINGNGQIEGLIYTRGEFRVNGGGGGLNVNGGVWAGEEVELNGNATVSFNQTYMDAVENLKINAEVQISSWRDQQRPYPTQ